MSEMYSINTTVQTFGVGKIFLMFLKVSYAHQVFIHWIKYTVKTAILWNIITI